MSALDLNRQIPTKQQFSVCSKRQIDPVLKAKSTCFKPYQARCGNGIKEYGEGRIFNWGILKSNFKSNFSLPND